MEATDDDADASPAKRRSESRSRRRRHAVTRRNDSSSNRRLRSQLSARAIASPWLDAYDWEAVGRALLAAGAAIEDPDQHRAPGDSPQMSTKEALERVAAWKTRVAGRLPHAVETTAALALILHDDRCGGGGSAPTLTTDGLRLSYSCAVLRAVNGWADTLQQSRGAKASVSSCCRELGIPAWLVDVRHGASHNRLPPLPVLRVASRTLLEHCRAAHWDPVAAARREESDRACELLENYRTMAEGSSDDEKAGGAHEVDDGNDSSSSGGDSEEEPFSTEPTLGTTSNRFAALQDTKPKKEKAKLEGGSANEDKQRKHKKADAKMTPHSCARKFVKARIPADIAYHAALSFFVWGGKDRGGDADSSGARLLRGVFVPEDAASESTVARLRALYGPLLLVLVREWPGFLHALLVHCVDAILYVEGSIDLHDDSEGRRAAVVGSLYFLDSWVRYLLSRSFLVHLDRSAKDKKSGGTDQELTEMAPLSVLKAFQLPLNSLCDRCSFPTESSFAGSSRRATSLGLARLFSNILGKERVAYYGIDFPETAFPEPEESNDALKQKSTSLVVGAPRPAMSLAEMEAFLAEDCAATITVLEEKKPLAAPSKSTGSEEKKDTGTKDSEGTTETKQKPSSTVWQRCEHWEPCAIGTLPGYPV